MKAWDEAQLHEFDEVLIRALDLTYGAVNDLVANVECEQRFALGLDETGVRAVAETIMITGDSDFMATQSVARFGESRLAFLNCLHG